MRLTDDLIRKRKRPSGGQELIWTDTHASFLSEQLVDVNDNATIGYYVHATADEKPSRCEVGGKHCQSSKEWNAPNHTIFA